MSDKKISDLVELTTLAADDVLPVVDSSANATKRITGANLSKFPSGVTVPDGGTIGSASDADAITIDATGNVALSQALQLGDGTAISSLGADSFRLAANATSDGTLTGWERVNELESGLLGTGMSESSGSFTFPSAGIYLVIFAVTIRVFSGDNFAGASLLVNGNEHQRLQGFVDDRNDTEQVVTQLSVLDVDTADTLTTDVFSLGGQSEVSGETSTTRTSLTFVRLGDA